MVDAGAAPGGARAAKTKCVMEGKTTVVVTTSSPSPTGRTGGGGDAAVVAQKTTASGSTAVVNSTAPASGVSAAASGKLEKLETERNLQRKTSGGPGVPTASSSASKSGGTGGAAASTQAVERRDKLKAKKRTHKKKRFLMAKASRSMPWSPLFATLSNVVERLRPEAIIAFVFGLLRAALSFPVRFTIMSLSPALQDIVLAVPLVRVLACLAFRKQCNEYVSKLIRPPQQIAESFDTIPYYVGEDAVKLLMHAAAHSLLKDASIDRRILREWRRGQAAWGPDVDRSVQRTSSSSSIRSRDAHEDIGNHDNRDADDVSSMRADALPSVGRVLICAPQGQILYLDSVARSLARAMGAYLLAVDVPLLSALLDAVIGRDVAPLNELLRKDAKAIAKAKMRTEHKRSASVKQRGEDARADAAGATATATTEVARNGDASLVAADDGIIGEDGENSEDTDDYRDDGDCAEEEIEDSISDTIAANVRNTSKTKKKEKKGASSVSSPKSLGDRGYSTNTAMRPEPISTGGSIESLFCWFLSFFLAGGRYSFAIDMIHSVLGKLPGPVIVYVRDVERTICLTPDRYDAFVSTFGASNNNLAHDLGAPFCGNDTSFADAKTRCMILGASCNATASVAVGGIRSGGDDAGLDGNGTGGGGNGSNGAVDVVREAIGELSGGADVGVGFGDDTIVLMKAMLSSLFTTRVVLNAGVGNERELSEHKKQIAQDAEDERAESNYHKLATVARAAGQKVPASTSEIYREVTGTVSVHEWSRALSWAVSMRRLKDTQATHAEIMRVLRGGPNDAMDAHETQALLLDKDEKKMKRKEEMEEEDGRTRRDGMMTDDTDDDGNIGGSSEPVTEDELRYGLRMAQAGNFGSLSNPEARPSNSYERRIMSELVHPEDVGAGFSEVGALTSVKDALREAVQLPLQYPGLFTRGSLQRPSRGVLLFGPPGTGKTLLARAAAAECGACFLAISPATVTSKWLGDGVRNTRAVFSLARKVAPAVIFIDEVDSLLGRRNNHSEHEALREIKNEFMSQWDGLRTKQDMGSQIMVLAATNRPQDLDEAVLRRFSRRLFVDLPDREGRESILRVLLRDEELDANAKVSVDEVATKCDGYSGSDLKNVCSAAAMIPVREMLEKTSKARKRTEAKSAGRARVGAAKSDASVVSAPSDASSSQLSSSSQSSSCAYLDSHGRLRRDEIINDFERIRSGEDTAVPRLRLISMKDFSAAIEQVGPTVSADSYLMRELREWNSKYGDESRNRDFQQLSYYL